MASILPPGYLQHENPGINKSSIPDVKFHDGGKGIFKLKLKLHSTINTNVSGANDVNRESGIN